MAFILIIVGNTNNDDVIRRPDPLKMSAQFRLVINMVAEHFFFYLRKSKQICSVYICLKLKILLFEIRCNCFFL